LGVSRDLVPANLTRPPAALGRAAARLPALVVDSASAGARQVRAFVRVGLVLEQAADRLAEIETRVERLDEEVALMRRGVDSVGAEAAGMRAAVEPLGEKLDHVAESVAPLRRFRRRRSG
jgi:lipase chaperone LimK